jgi:hypothetical protein
VDRMSDRERAHFACSGASAAAALVPSRRSVTGSRSSCDFHPPRRHLSRSDNQRLFPPGKSSHRRAAIIPSNSASSEVLSVISGHLTASCHTS